MPSVTMKEMLEAGVHFGHQTAKWNPKMKPYVFGAKSGIYIIDLQKTVGMANKAADFVKSVAASGGRMIFVGTKKQAREVVKETAQKCHQFYMTERWLGGTLTNFETIKASINRLRKLDQMKEKDEYSLYAKKEAIKMEKERVKLNETLEGIKDMKDAPAAAFIIDLKKEHIAVLESQKLGIPIVGLADTNCDPEVCEYPIPSNDDAIRAIRLFANMVAEAYNEGAAVFEEKLRAMTDKELSEGKDKPAKKADSKEQAEGEGDGPAIVRRTKKRTLVAAGTAEDRLDDQEVEQTVQAAASKEESSEEADTASETTTEDKE